MTEGVRFLPEYLSQAARERLVADILTRLDASPPDRPVMPATGAPLRVRMTHPGSPGRVSDRRGYRCSTTHTVTGQAWGPIPEALLDVWRDVSGYGAPPEARLVNGYEPGARLCPHIDADEDAEDAPVVWLSPGARALFRLGGLQRSSPTSSLRLASGDLAATGGAAGRAYHGVDRIYPGSSRLAPGGGRINLTLRRVRGPS